MVESIKIIFEEYGYEFYEDPYKLNVIGIRKKIDTNFFDDELWVIYKDKDGKYVEHKFSITTDPGRTSVLSRGGRSNTMVHVGNNVLKSVPTGTAILVPGQYKDTYAIDRHRNQYNALCQRLGKVCVYRDRNKDSKHDMDKSTIECGFFGINIHRSNTTKSILVDGWSAGCQVFSTKAQFDEFMKLCETHRKHHGNEFTYTLLQML